MNRLRSATAQLALATLISLALLVVACGGDDQAQPAEATASQPQQADEPAADPADETSQQSESEAPDSKQQGDQQPSQPTTTPAERQEEDPDPQPVQEQSQQQDSDDPESEGELEVLLLTLQPILGGYQFQQPIELLQLPDGSFLVAEQRGYITRFVEDDGEIEQFGILDLTESVRFGGEEGLLSIALHPDLQNEPYLYVYYSPKDASVTRLSRFRLELGAALMSPELVIIEVAQPYSNHNGGTARIGPDGMLYLGYGDGGAANDPQGHGQNRETLLGAIIRIDVEGIDTSTPYRIPTDNPFLGVAGVRPEIWAYGLRNPWRMAFDPQTDLLWVGDVGQNRVEEIAIVRAGENHGWNVFEGDECFGRDADCGALSNAVAPVAVYGHGEGCSVTGGMVYRGAALPHLDGVYLFGDYCSGTIWGLWPDDDAETGWTRNVVLESDLNIASFAVDRDGEIYVLAFNGPIRKLVSGDR
jgi:glucose/arabinose dehydrogenase